MSFLRAQGHIYAHRYPLWMLWHEMDLARKRINREYKTQAMIFLQACTAANSADPKAATKNFSEFLEKFDDGEDD